MLAVDQRLAAAVWAVVRESPDAGPKIMRVASQRLLREERLGNLT